jgi:ribose 5-phosphate isomerase A
VYVTDNGNYIVDLKLPYPCKNPVEHNRLFKNIPGVLETGLFLGLATIAIVGYTNGVVQTLER